MKFLCLQLVPQQCWRCCSCCCVESSARCCGAVVVVVSHCRGVSSLLVLVSPTEPRCRCRGGDTGGPCHAVTPWTVTPAACHVTSCRTQRHSTLVRWSPLRHRRTHPCITWPHHTQHTLGHISTVSTQGNVPESPSVTMVPGCHVPCPRPAPAPGHRSSPTLLSCAFTGETY